MNTLVISFLPEGSTDIRFLSGVIIRTAIDIIFERAEAQVDVSDVIPLNIPRVNGRDQQILAAAKESDGYHILIVHSDSDDQDEEDALTNRINPGFELVENEIGKICKNLVAIIPIRMTENWMIADKKALKDEIGTNKSDLKLELNFPLKNVELIANPKQKLRRVLELACSENPARLERFDVVDLYLPLGQKVDLSVLSHLDSYKKFKCRLTDALIKTNYIQ
jgi:hypothetical protein